MPINAYPGYPLAFDNIKMGESEIEKLAGLLKEHDKMKVENCPPRHRELVSATEFPITVPFGSHWSGTINSVEPGS